MSKLRFLITGLALAAAGGAVALLFDPAAGGDSIDAGPSRDGFCAEHRIAADECPWCRPELLDKLGFCVGHNVPEALCSRCNPRLVPGFQAIGDWCAEHALPESQCLVCSSPETTDAAGSTSPNETLAALSVDELPRSARPPSPTCATESLQVRFASPDISKRAGLAYERVERRSLARTLERNAELVFDANRHARISSRAPGVLREIRKNVGDRVEQDETIAVIDSPVLAEAKATYFRSQALLSLRERTLERERKLLDAGAGTERALFEAETGVAEASIVLRDAEERLRSLGLATSEIARLASEKDTSGELHLKTPFAGTIVERSASIGESVDPGDPIISIADVSTLWAKIELREEDVGIVERGLRATLEVSGLSRRRFEGELLWIGSRVDRRTRTLEACAEIPNPDGLLRDGMFARAVIVLGEDGDGSIAVPKAAVQWDGCCNIVFLKRSESVFEPRRVSLGWETDEFFAVKGGVAEGDVVVTTGSFLLKTEILKESIGAGCCEPRAGG